MKSFFIPLTISLFVIATSHADERPNIILMMADDLANEDLSGYGSTRIKTPVLDKLATEGIKLSSFYSGSSVCTPSRMALLSGAYPARSGWRNGVLYFGFEEKTGMSPRVYTMAEAFRDSGYHTAISGKWHLGEKEMRPENQGFDSAYYIFMSNNQNRDMYRDRKLVQKEWDNRLLTETFTKEAIRVIKEERKEPFFLYLPWTAPHYPVDPHPDWQGKSGKNKSAKYTDVVEELDHRIGEILKALEESGQADHTIVIFTSDNGRMSAQADPNDVPPYSGGKWHASEGGSRLPFILRYPREIQAGKQHHGILAAIDLFPTLADACGVTIDLPEDAQKMDGINLWSNLAGKEPSPARNELLYWHGKGKAAAIRIGDWKLFFNYGGGPDPKVKDGPELYQLSEDPLEENNLAVKHPEKVKEMMARAKALLSDIYKDPLPLGAWPGVELSKPPVKASNVWGKWMN